MKPSLIPKTNKQTNNQTLKRILYQSQHRTQNNGVTCSQASRGLSIHCSIKLLSKAVYSGVLRFQKEMLLKTELVSVSSWTGEGTRPTKPPPLPEEF